MKYVHTNIITKDWKKLSDFYIKVFDCKIMPPVRKQEGEWLSQGTGVTKASLEGAHLLLPGYGENGPTLEIYQYAKIKNQTAVSPNQRGFGHIAFEVESVASMVEKIIEHGGSKNGVITSRNIEGVGVISFIYVRDPDGNLIELQNWKKNAFNNQSDL